MERLHIHTLLHRTSYKTVLSQYILALAGVFFLYKCVFGSRFKIKSLYKNRLVN